MGMLEIPLIVAGWILTAAIAGVGGTFAIQGRNSKRVEDLRTAADTKIEKLIKENDERINTLISANTLQNENVLNHIKNVERSLNDMRAELPEKYTLKSDHLRLVDKVEELSMQFYKHREKEGE
jgi:adenylosuccinate synthase